MEPAQGGQIRSRSAAGAKRERREHAGDMISRSYLFNRKPARWLSVGWALVFVMRGLKWKCSDRLGFVGVNTGYERLINQHNRVGQISSAREIITILLACICRVRINKIVIDSAAYWDFHISFHGTNGGLPSYSIVHSPRRLTFCL